MNLNRAVAVFSTALLSLSFAACSSGGTIASVNGQKITKADFDTKLEASQSGKGTLNQMIQSDLIDQYAKDHNINPSDAEIQAKVDQIKARYPAGQFDVIVKQQGLTDADVRNIFRQQIVLEKAVESKVNVSEADIKAFFARSGATLDKPEQVRARHILVPDLATANIVEAKLKAGGKFEDLSKQYSTDPASKDKGGELGFFGHNQMVKPFDQAAFSLPVGQISRPVKSPFGYHIIQVEEKRPAVKATLASAHDAIKAQLGQQAQQQQVPPFMQSLRSQANITISDDRFKDMGNVPTPGGGAPATAVGTTVPVPSTAPTK